MAELRQAFKSGRTRSVSWRKRQLRAIINLVQDNEENIFKALYQDLGKHPVECYRDEVRKRCTQLKSHLAISIDYSAANVYTEKFWKKKRNKNFSRICFISFSVSKRATQYTTLSKGLS